MAWACLLPESVDDQEEMRALLPEALASTCF